MVYIKKIAIIHPFQFRYARGIERFTWELGKTFTERSVMVDLLTWQYSNPISWGETPTGMQIRQVPAVRYFRNKATVPFYASWLACNHYDWVMVYFAGYGEVEALRMASLFHPQKVCAVLHFPRQQVPHRYAEFEQLGLASRINQFVAVSEYVASGVREQFNRPCAVISNGIDTNTFHPNTKLRQEVRQQMGIGPDDPVLVTLAALEERKGIQWVLRSLPNLLSEFPHLHYWIFGEGDYRVALEAEIRSLGLEKSVHIHGATDNVIPYLAAADIGCLLSYGEAFGIALLEYAAMELPVVTSNHPPFPDLISSEWGEMVSEKNVQAVSQCIATLLRNPGKREQMGKFGRLHVIEHYSWASIADQYIQLLWPDHDKNKV